MASMYKIIFYGKTLEDCKLFLEERPYLPGDIERDSVQDRWLVSCMQCMFCLSFEDLRKIPQKYVHEPNHPQALAMERFHGTETSNNDDNAARHSTKGEKDAGKI